MVWSGGGLASSFTLNFLTDEDDTAVHVHHIKEPAVLARVVEEEERERLQMRVRVAFPAAGSVGEKAGVEASTVGVE